MNEVLSRMPLDAWEDKKFPKQYCIKKTKEAGVKEADAVSFLCILVDKRFTQGLRILLLKPYTWTGKGDNGRAETLLGWVDSNGNVFDHKECSIHNDNETVVAWRKA